MPRTHGRLVARTRGQVMVLGAVSLLVMALMLMASFAVSNAIHEKIRIQNHADAEAYSMAVLEARTFNIITHYNRAIAATLVAQMSLHSWMAIASTNVAQLEGEAMAVLIVAGLEFAMCPPYFFQHCIHGLLALFNSFALVFAASDWWNKLKNHEQAFNDAVKALKEMADALSQSQNAAIKKMYDLFPTSNEMLTRLKQINASQSTYIDGVAELNQRAYACAMEGSEVDDNCSGDFERRKSSASDRSKVMENAANAARPFFDQFSFIGLMAGVNPKNWDWSNADVPSAKKNLWQGSWQLVFETTSASVSQSTSKGSSDDEGKDVGASGFGFALVQNYFDIPVSPAVFKADIYSDSRGGQHNTFLSNDRNHREFKGEVMGDPCGDSNCFVNYRASSDPNMDFGEPTVYGAVSQSLRLYQLKDNSGFGQKPPWELNDQGKVQIQLGDVGSPTVNYLPAHEAYAVSKAKVYFHQLGRWDSPPNFFDPFWRAKLHFFTRDEMKKLLTNTVNDPDGQDLINANAPVEGQ